MKKLSCSIVLWLLFVAALASPSFGQGAPPTVKLCIPTSGTSCPPVNATNPLPISGSFSATLAGFTPNGNYGTLTATAASSASTAMPAGTSVSFQNLSTIDVSCVLSAGAATATTNKLIVRGGATVYYTVGSNVNAACINQTGSASNVIAMAGGTGLGTNFGGGSSGGGGGGAVTLAASSVAIGAYVSGSVLSGAYASGALVDITNVSTPIAAGAATATKGLLLGGQFDTTQKTLTNGQQGAVSLSARGAVFVATGADAFTVTATNLSTNVAQINGVTPLMGNGATGTGSQRVTIANDTTMPALTAGSAIIGKVGIDQSTPGTTNLVSIGTGGTVNPTTAASWGVLAQGATTSGQLGGLMLGAVTTAAPAYTTAQSSPLSLDTAGNLRVNVVAGGAGGGAVYGPTAVGAAAANPPVLLGGTATGLATGNVAVATIKAGNTAGTTDPSIVVADPNLLAAVSSGVGTPGSTSPSTDIAIGCNVATSEQTARTNGQNASAACDAVGKQIVLPFANPENFLNGQITTAMTATTSTALTGMGAQGAGVRVYVTSCTFSNSHASVGTMVNLQDGSGGSVLWQAPTSSVYGGAVVTFPTPIKTTANTGLFAVNATTGSSTFVSCTGYKGI